MSKATGNVVPNRPATTENYSNKLYGCFRVVAEQYDKRGSTSGVIGNLILLSSPAAKTSFVFKFTYAGREGLYFFTGTGLQIITKPYGIDNYMELIYQDSAIYIHETGSVPMSYAYKKL